MAKNDIKWRKMTKNDDKWSKMVQKWHKSGPIWPISIFMVLRPHNTALPSRLLTILASIYGLLAGFSKNSKMREQNDPQTHVRTIVWAQKGCL